MTLDSPTVIIPTRQSLEVEILPFIYLYINIYLQSFFPNDVTAVLVCNEYTTMYKKVKDYEVVGINSGLLNRF